MTTLTKEKTYVTIRVRDAFTNEYLIDNRESPIDLIEFDADVFAANANSMSESFPNCSVTFEASNGDFCCLMPLNQRNDEALIDEGKMTLQEYMDKWYPQQTSLV